MKSREIRKTFIDYFGKLGHAPVASSSLIPENDATLLFANAGMNQFKNLFLGLEQRPYSRAVTSQKCVRAGGKHNDLENVGHTARHHTFFEMLGNFSFGDYFKKDAIHFAWDLLTKELGLPKDRLYVTVFTDDDEAADIWHKQEGVARDRIYRFGEKDNFWRMGDVGPCGPCSEIFYDHGPDADDDPSKPSEMGGDGDRFVEIWNNVFMQFNESESGRAPLPKPSVDTGAGLERWAAVLQGTNNNYNTDVFLPIIERACKIAKLDMGELIELERAARRAKGAPVKGKSSKEILDRLAALRVVADHSRAAAFLIADGVMPSNEGRGYVLRRIMRRAIRYGRTLSDDQSLYAQTVGVVLDDMSDVYPELARQKQTILYNVNDETQRFVSTLDQGTEILNSALAKLSSRGEKSVDGETVFKLYDTFGFPIDLTRLMAEEQGFRVDEAAFSERMEAARKKAKASWKGKAIAADAAHLIQFGQAARDKGGPTTFVGYAAIKATAQATLLSDGTKFVDSLKAGDDGVIAFNHTPFYAEGGGQVGDHGEIRAAGGGVAEVLDTVKTNEVWLHHVRVTDGSIKTGESCLLQVADSRRRNSAANHSATHLLHAALRQTLGPHVSQAGSLVDPDRLRFDFTHGKPLSSEELLRLEDLVNEEISKATEVSSAEMAQKEALAAGALALFGEKYGDRVRVIKMGDFSTELCGGTHVSNTAQIRLFKIVSEGGVSAGVRRIEALSGDAAVAYAMKNARENLKARAACGYQESWMQYLMSESDQASQGAGATVSDWIERAKQDAKALEREIKTLRGGQIDVDALAKSARAFTSSGVAGRLVTARLDVDDRAVLSDVADKLKDLVQSGVVILVGKGEGSHPIVVSVTKDLTKSLSAGKILGEVAAKMGGKGGGRPDFAQGAAPDLANVEAAFARAGEIVGA